MYFLGRGRLRGVNSPILGFSDRQLAILKRASAPLSRDERSRFLRESRGG
jgi:hypothetical protein